MKLRAGAAYLFIYFYILAMVDERRSLIRTLCRSMRDFLSVFVQLALIRAALMMTVES